jgi:8-oxo-dGTP pyrophosphatase MutT (NUDIX family)
MDERHVVTCFLIDRRPDGDRLLLARRGDRVGSYQGRWAAISGTIETTPDEQALTEIREETGLGPDQVRRLARGRPLAVEDAALDRRWVVHPYLFEVEEPAAARLNWEHAELRWIAPADLASYATVPQLAAALARVYPPPAAGAP